MVLTVNPDQLDQYLALRGTIDRDRAELVIRLIMDDAVSIVRPVPENALGVILTAAGRLYGNPAAVAAESAGNFSVSHPLPGAYLTRRERARLRRLAGLYKGAYTVDPTPPTANPRASWPPTPTTAGAHRGAERA